MKQCHIAGLGLSFSALRGTADSVLIVATDPNLVYSISGFHLHNTAPAAFTSIGNFSALGSLSSAKDFFPDMRTTPHGWVRFGYVGTHGVYSHDFELLESLPDFRNWCGLTSQMLYDFSLNVQPPESTPSPGSTSKPAITSEEVSEAVTSMPGSTIAEGSRVATAEVTTGRLVRGAVNF
mmetsp:Transcript_33651/g.69502  ORF Transcript_33651/g.69502 Transcript_33651/m.69502 type:complete len:179 (-) Transcript_33651:246-782(-)